MFDWGRAICGLALALAAGCYGRAEATRDTNEAWRGRPRPAMEADWGAPDAVTSVGETEVLRYVKMRTVATGPTYEASPDRYHMNVFGEAAAFFKNMARPRRTVVDAEALVAVADGRIEEVGGASLRWGPPEGENLRWGTVLGMHAGLGALDDTPTPLPSGGAYLGGMLSPTFALTGTFSLASGKGDAGGAIGVACGMAAQWWPLPRLWLRSGPALTLDFDPGFVDSSLGLGVTGGASYAVVKAGTFVLDLRIDVTVGPSATFGTAGVGVNLN